MVGAFYIARSLSVLCLARWMLLFYGLQFMRSLLLLTTHAAPASARSPNPG